MQRLGSYCWQAGLAVAVGLSVLLSPLRAATPREELLRYVPEDVGFCLVVQDLRGHATDLAASPFIKSVKEMPFAAGLAASPDLQKLLDADKFLQTTLNVDAARLRDDVLGDALVFAYRPGPADKPDAEQGLVLIRARDPKLLAEVVDRINELQRQSGELKELKSLTYKDVTYYRRVEAKKDATGAVREESNYYFLRGPVLAFTSQDAILREAIDRDAKLPAEEESPVAKQFRLSNAQKAFVSLWINPRAFDKEMTRKAESAPAAEKAVLKTVLTYWSALDSIVLWADLQKNLELKFAVRARTKQLPPAAQRFLAEAAKPSELWDRFPSDAMFAIAGRFDFAALVETIQAFLPPEMSKSLKDAMDRGFGATLGPDLLTDVLTCIGPDWGMCIAAPPSDEKAWFPQTVFALRVRPGDKKPPVDQAVLDAVNFFAGVAVLSHNGKPGEALRLKTANQEKVEVKYLTGGGLPDGLQPAYTLHNGYLLLASSPDAIHRFHSEPTTNKEKSALTDDVPLLRVSFKQLRRFVKERREHLTVAVAEKNQITKEEAGKKLDGLVAVLQVVDRLDLSHRSEAGQVTFTLRLQTAQPLK